MIKIIISIFLLGLSFGFGPCISSCGPVLLSYVAGTKKDIFKSILVYILFSLSRILAYVLLSLAVFFIGRFVQEKLLGGILYKILVFLGGVFVILVGASMLAGKSLEFKPWQLFCKNILERGNKSILLLGLIMGLIPCAPLLALFYYIGLVSKTWLHTIIYSVAFGFGTSISPLIVLVVLAGLIPGFLGTRHKAYRIFSSICGVIMIILGLQLLVRLF